MYLSAAGYVLYVTRFTNTDGGATLIFRKPGQDIYRPRYLKHRIFPNIGWNKMEARPAATARVSRGSSLLWGYAPHPAGKLQLWARELSCTSSRLDFSMMQGKVP